MWTTFLVVLKMNLRSRSALFWLIVFPLVLATMFNGVLGQIDQGYDIKPMSMAVVEDSNWRRAVGADAFVDALAGKKSSSDATDGSYEGTATGLDQRLIDITTVASTTDARHRLADDGVQGYLNADGDGRLRMTLSSDTADSAGDSASSDVNATITISALHGAIELYNRTDAITRETIEKHPNAAASARFRRSVGAAADLTKETALTNFRPDAIARYYYALLGMACLMAMSYAVAAVTFAQANLSALGIRRAVAPLGRARQLFAGFLASWLCAGTSLLIALAYIRYGCGVLLGGREPAAVLAVAVASFMSCAFGTMIGAIPKLSHGAKIGLTSAIPCVLSLFSGLYGSFAMELSDWIARHAPVLAFINPAQQVTNLFYDILYYDSYRPFVATCVRLLVMSVAFLAVGVILLRRQRYEHL
ncbi:ABC transporter permease [Bifidobacterium callimiconis]|uniref:ABC transporter permease n=1 Tax=Bifidobacterium callimiconis TaxID=2306973 RepID=UPI001BDD468A|nr:ABC transporter permease [Bifidobacterium callimiconis]MBT1176366.1 ABC transporter permease [Bifidobacterium callimiconis]